MDQITPRSPDPTRFRFRPAEWLARAANTLRPGRAQAVSPAPIVPHDGISSRVEDFRNDGGRAAQTDPEVRAAEQAALRDALERVLQKLAEIERRPARARSGPLA